MAAGFYSGPPAGGADVERRSRAEREYDAANCAAWARHGERLRAKGLRPHVDYDAESAAQAAAEVAAAWERLLAVQPDGYHAQ